MLTDTDGLRTLLRLERLHVWKSYGLRSDSNGQSPSPP